MRVQCGFHRHALARATTNAKDDGQIDDGRTKKAWERPEFAKNSVRIWDINIDDEFARVDEARDEVRRRKSAEASRGLGFARKTMLDDLTIDLSSTLRRNEERGGGNSISNANANANANANDAVKLLTPGRSLETTIQSTAVPEELKYVDRDGKMIGSPSALELATTKKGESKYNLNGWNYAPTRAEKGRWQREWEKAERAKAMKTPGYRPASSNSIKSKIKDATFTPTRAFADLTDEEKARRRAIDAAKYTKIKEDLLLTTAGMAGSGAIAAFVVGGNNMGFSWLLGAAGALAYVRLLSGKAESEGGGQGGPPSILVPVVLFMALNRYNTFYAEDLGVTLTPIPMLLAFFTYKPASILQAFKDVLGEDDADDEGQPA